MPEITLADEFGRAIAQTIRACNVQTVIEVGSWDGTGSTTVVMQALEPVVGKRLTCIEANPERHAALASLTASREWVTTVCSRSVSRDAMTPKTFADMWRSPYNRLRYPEHEVQRWWNEQTDGPGYLESLTTETFDAALIDGCEFSGWDDYRLLRDRVRVLMLDDVFSAYKCAEADEDLRRRGEWSCLWRSAFVRNGASIWVRAL
jgi:hypothetical protein